ncbi:MAG TPA: gephyrin-like molybdotransferase Glp [Mycobacteriales bacterium]
MTSPPVADVSVDEQLATVLAAIAPLEPLELQLVEAAGALLAEDVVAPRPLPMFDYAAVDGYAVQLADVGHASRAHPARLPVVGGGPVAALSVQPGIAVRVAAGVALPAGAEAVVPLGWTEPGDGTVAIQRSPSANQLVRRRGDDVAEGSTVLTRGMQLGAVQAGILASLGLSRVRVHPRPRVVVLSTGDALLEAGELVEGGHSFDGNSHALATAAREAGGTPYRLPAVRNTVDALSAVLEDHLIQADLVVVSARLRPGGYDPLPEVLDRLGEVSVHHVALDPGALHVFGRIGDEGTPVFVLPADPVAAMVGFEIFVRPAIRRMLGATATGRPQVRAQVTRAVRTVPGKRQYVRAQLRHDATRGYLATPVAAGAPTLSALAASNALLVVPEDAQKVEAGAALDAVLLERRGV